MDPLYIVIFVSFSLGAMGYILTQFWIRPILKYQRIKHRIASGLQWYAQHLDFESKQRASLELSSDRLQAIRRDSTELTACFHDDLPPWYKLLLQRRQESPADASKHLMALSNISNPDHADMRLIKIKAALRLK